MRKYVHGLAAVALLCGVALCLDEPRVRAQANPIVGTWVLNRAKSTFDGAAVPEKRRMTFEASGDSIKHVTDTTNANGSIFRVEYTAKLDGMDYPISNSFLSTVSLKRIDANTFERTGKLRGESVETYTMKLSAGGKVLTITQKGTNNGTDYNNLQVFDKQ